MPLDGFATLKVPLIGTHLSFARTSIKIGVFISVVATSPNADGCVHVKVLSSKLTNFELVESSFLRVSKETIVEKIKNSKKNLIDKINLFLPFFVNVKISIRVSYYLRLITTAIGYIIR